MFIERTSLGLDVHARSVRAAAIDTSTGEVIERTLSPKPAAIVEFARSLIEQGHGPVLATDEAGPTGFGVARAFQEAGIACQIASLSRCLCK